MESQDHRERQWQEKAAEILQSIKGGKKEVYIRDTMDIGNTWSASRPDKVMEDLVLIGNAMEGNTSLEFLRLSCLHLNEQATVALANGIRQSKIKKVSLRGLSFVEDTPGGGQRVANILCDSIQRSTTLEELTVVDMDEYTSMFSIGAITTTSLKTFHLFRLMDDRHGSTQDLLRSLQNNNSLTNILFYNQDIDDQDVRLLVESLHPNLPLVSLRLPRNNIGPMDVQALLRAMAHHPTWNELVLDRNTTIGFEGLRVLGVELQNMHQHVQRGINITVPRFISVDVNTCVSWKNYKAEEEETEAAKQLNNVRKSAEQALLDGVQDNVLIVKLQLDQNFLSETTLTKIKFYVHLNHMGRYLLGTDHGLASTVWCHILAKCNQKEDHWCEWDKRLASSVLFYLLREQPHLVVPRASYTY